MIKLEDIKKNLKNFNQSYIGIQSIAIDDIVGTVGRYPKFNEFFIQDRLEETLRYKSVKKHFETNNSFPPIKVYKIKDKYFILDGHHRIIFLKKETAVKFIEAEILNVDFEIDIDSQDRQYYLTNDFAKDFLIELERDSFENKTGLFSDVLTFPIDLTELSSYAKLFNELKDHHKLRVVSAKEENLNELSPVYSNLLWYKEIFLPTIEKIKEEKIISKFPHRTESDLYVWINLHKYYLSEKRGESVDIEYSVEDFIKNFGKNNVSATLKKMFKWLNILKI